MNIKVLIRVLPYVLILFLISCHDSIRDIDIDYLQLTVSEHIPVTKTNPIYIIYPLNLPSRPPSAYIIPFKIMVSIKNKKFVEYELTKIFYNNWIKNRVFPSIIISNHPVSNLNLAIEDARMAKCNLLIYPKITHLIFGGQLSTTYISIKIDIYDTTTGKLIWSITHAGEIKPLQEKDYVFFKIKHKIPLFPESLIIDTLANDIYPPIKKWGEQTMPIF